MSELATQLHWLKTWTEPFSAIWDGRKQFEYRFNDRDYHVGDELMLEEWSGAMGGGYSGRKISAKVTYVAVGPEWGIADGYAVLSLGDVLVLP